MPEKVTTNHDHAYCEFCYKTAAQVKILIASNDQVYICDECVEVCLKILNEHK